MATAHDAFEILDGVRRSKAAELTGRTSVRGQVDDGTGALGPVIDIPVDQLHSPHKDSIDISDPTGLRRWLDTLGKAMRGSPPPPIIVRRGRHGPRIQNVKLER